RPDATAETFAAFQEQGWTNSGTLANPALAVQLAQAAAAYTDPLGHTTTLRPDWRGQGLTVQATDPAGNVTTDDRDANGLATATIDRLNRVTLVSYDGKGNAITITPPNLTTDQYTYNGFAEPTTHTDALNHTTTTTYDAHGN